MSRSARHEEPEIDEAALAVARLVERAAVASGAIGAARWERYLARLPDRLRDDPPASLRPAARAVRAAYGPKDSIRDALPADATEPLLTAVDRLLRLLDRRDARVRD